MAGRVKSLPRGPPPQAGLLCGPHSTAQTEPSGEGGEAVMVEVLFPLTFPPPQRHAGRGALYHQGGGHGPPHTEALPSLTRAVEWDQNSACLTGLPSIQ